MSNSAFARLPEPPYSVLTFSSRRGEGEDEACGAAAQHTVELAALQPDFPGMESARDDHRFGITVSHWRDEAAIIAWKQQAEHAATPAFGRAPWYDHYELRVAKVERAYGKKVSQ